MISLFFCTVTEEKVSKEKVFLVWWAFTFHILVWFAQSPRWLERFAFALAARAFHFFVRTKKRNKEKRRLRSGAKKSSYFFRTESSTTRPKRKELASLKQLFVLHGKYSIFLHAPPLRPEKPSLEGTSLRSWCGCTRDPSLRYAPLWMTKKQAKPRKKNTTPQRAKPRKKTPPQRAKRCCEKAQRSGLTFLPWSEGAFRSVKNKKLFERSEFFLFSAEKCRSRQKSADGEFSLFRFFCSGKRNEKPSRLEREQSDKALAAIEQKA